MYLEYCNYNTQEVLSEESEIKQIFNLIEEQKIGGVCTDIHTARELATMLPFGFVLSCPVDFPMGKSDSKLRQHEAIANLKAGANALDVVCNRKLLQNRKWKALESDIKTIGNICHDYGASLRVLINTDDDMMENNISVCKIMKEYGVDIILPSIGYHNVEFVDCLITCHMIEQECDMYTICNGYMHKETHIKDLQKSGIFGGRLYYNNLKLVYN